MYENKKELMERVAQEMDVVYQNFQGDEKQYHTYLLLQAQVWEYFMAYTPKDIEELNEELGTLKGEVQYLVRFYANGSVSVQITTPDMVEGGANADGMDINLH